MPAQVESEALRRLYLVEHWPIAAIAAHFGVSASTIGNHRRRYGIPIRPRYGEGRKERQGENETR